MDTANDDAAALESAFSAYTALVEAPGKGKIWLCTEHAQDVKTVFDSEEKALAWLQCVFTMHCLSTHTPKENFEWQHSTDNDGIEFRGVFGPAPKYWAATIETHPVR